MGTDMAPVLSDHYLPSWVGVCPGSNESGGKRKSGKTTKGNRWLCTALVQGPGPRSRKKTPLFEPNIGVWPRVEVRNGLRWPWPTL